MANKAHKKLRELARLQALHGNQHGATMQAASVQPAMAGIANPTHISSGSVNHLHAELVKRDLRDLLGLIVLMIVMLLGLYWLVANTSFANWLLSLGHGIK